MPSFKTLKEAEKYGTKNYFNPEYTETIYGNWEVKDMYDEMRK